MWINFQTIQTKGKRASWNHYLHKKQEANTTLNPQLLKLHSNLMFLSSTLSFIQHADQYQARLRTNQRIHDNLMLALYTNYHSGTDQ